MSNIKREFITGEIYHLFNRGVEKRDVFMDESDRFRFVFSLYECNDATEVRVGFRISQRRQRFANSARFHLASLQGETLQNLQEPAPPKRKLLVEIIAFVLMGNHYHLAVRQLVDGGISLFMKKLSNSYTGYFNDKYERRGMGALFQGVFKSVHIKGDGQFLHLIEYLFSNPVEIIEPEWKDRGAQDWQKAVEFVDGYKWSSYQDSVGVKNFPSVTEREFLLQVFGAGKGIEAGQKNVKEYVAEWIKNKKFLSPGLSLE